ncbi:MAG TPA: helix-turn-helix transcriptional regulator [Thermoanaerobaculia bacterium]
MASVGELFGQTLRKLREEAGLTQEEVADRADIHWTYLSQVEGGKRNLGLENIVYLAKAIGVAPSEFFTAFTKTYVSNLPEKRRSRREE